MKSVRYTISPSGCWLCTSHAIDEGYPVVRRNGRKLRLCRVVFERHNGLLRPGEVVRHTCDTPLCINPGHLLRGTQADNIRDRDERGRGNIGEKAYQTNLKSQDVLKIRQSKKTIAEIAAEYGVSYNTIQKIRKRVTWKHLP